MKPLRTLAAFLAVVAVMFIIQSPALMPKFMMDLASSNFKDLREAPLVQFHLIAILVHAFLLAFIYPFGYRGGAPWAEGLRYGVLMALLISLPCALHIFAMVEAPAANQFYPVAWTVYVNAVAGIIVGVIHGRSAAVPSRRRDEVNPAALGFAKP